MHDLERFVVAQNEVWDDVLTELRRGEKRTHWMWFVFPQPAGLSRSPTGRHYAIGSFDEASAYLEHPVLGPRLRETVSMTLPYWRKGARGIFGTPDDMKFHSCLRLFQAVAPDDIFATALNTFANVDDKATSAILRRWAKA